MNLHLTDRLIRTTYRELLATQPNVTGRALRRELRTRFGAVGKTARIFQIWREESQAAQPSANSQLPEDLAELQNRLQAAETAAAENKLRAERAEYREQAHQDHWALKIDELREQLRAQSQQSQEIRTQQERVFRLSAELQAARAQNPNDFTP